MATSLLRIGRLASLKCLQLESLCSLRSLPVARLCTGAKEPAKDKTAEVPNERAALLSYKTAVDFPVKLIDPGVFSQQPLFAATETIASSTVNTDTAIQAQTETPTQEPAVAAPEVAETGSEVVEAVSEDTKPATLAAESLAPSISETPVESAEVLSEPAVSASAEEMVDSAPVIPETTVSESQTEVPTQKPVIAETVAGPKAEEDTPVSDTTSESSAKPDSSESSGAPVDASSSSSSDSDSDSDSDSEDEKLDVKTQATDTKEDQKLKDAPKDSERVKSAPEEFVDSAPAEEPVSEPAEMVKNTVIELETKVSDDACISEEKVESKGLTETLDAASPEVSSIEEVGTIPGEGKQTLEVVEDVKLVQELTESAPDVVAVAQGVEPAPEVVESSEASGFDQFVPDVVVAAAETATEAKPAPEVVVEEVMKPAEEVVELAQDVAQEGADLEVVKSTQEVVELDPERVESAPEVVESAQEVVTPAQEVAAPEDAKFESLVEPPVEPTKIPVSPAGETGAEELVDSAPAVEASAEEELVAAEASEGAAAPPVEPDEPFDNTTYKNNQHHSYTPFTFVDYDVEMAKYRLPQPSSGRPSPRH